MASAIADLGDFRLEYRDAGKGDAVVFVHGALIADAFEGLIAQPAISAGFRAITYRRRGYGRSSDPGRRLTIEEQAADAGRLMKNLGIQRAHLVGHSFGGAVCMQVALTHPETVQSLTLLEPAIVPGQSRQAYLESLALSGRNAERLGSERAVTEFLEMRFGTDFRTWLDSRAPGAFAEAVQRAAYCFGSELGALADWEFDEEIASRVEQPTLLVLGELSGALWSRFVETHEMLCSSLPNAEGYILPGATHGLQIQNPEQLATVLADFLQRYPIA